MPEPKVFLSVEEGVAELRKFGERWKLNGAFWKKVEKNEETIIVGSVDKSTFRAFRNLEVRPSELFRGWARLNIQEMIYCLNEVSSQEEYDKKLVVWTNSLIEFWRVGARSPDKRIQYGPAIKLVNLLIKELETSTKITSNKAIHFIHVPLDSYSLRPISRIFGNLTSLPYRIEIPRKSSMGSITTPDMYWIVQKAIFKLCHSAGISPILYDYWAWNVPHRK
jgi:hypothetical protein